MPFLALFLGGESFLLNASDGSHPLPRGEGRGEGQTYLRGGTPSLRATFFATFLRNHPNRASGLAQPPIACPAQREKSKRSTWRAIFPPSSSNSERMTLTTGFPPKKYRAVHSTIPLSRSARAMVYATEKSLARLVSPIHIFPMSAPRSRKTSSSNVASSAYIEAIVSPSARANAL